MKGKNIRKENFFKKKKATKQKSKLKNYFNLDLKNPKCFVVERKKH